MSEEFHDSRGAPPLAVWLGALCLAAALIVACLISVPMIHRQLIVKVQQDFVSGRSGPLVLVLGNSLSCTAIDAQVLQLPAGKLADIRVIPFLLAKFLTAAEVKTLARDLGAELLLVQEDFLFNKDAGRVLSNELLHLGYEYLLKNREAKLSDCRAALPSQMKLSSTFLATLVKKYARSNARANLSSMADVDSLQGAGFQVLALRVPRSESFEAGLPYLIDNRDEVEADLLARDIPVLKPDLARWPDRYFRDYRHMNDEGSRAYTAWLGTALAQVLPAP